MRTNEPKTPLLRLLRMLTPEQRDQFAADAATSVTYLYSLAGCTRKQCKADKAALIEAASRKLRAETRGRTPIITVSDLGSMCSCVD